MKKVVVDGVEYQLYSAEYHHGTSQWGFDFFATSMEDAQARIESMRQTAKLFGQIEGRYSLLVPGFIWGLWWRFEEWLSR